MSRIPRRRSDQAGLLARLIYAFSQHKYGAVLDPVAVMARQPRVLLAGVVELTYAIGLEN